MLKGYRTKIGAVILFALGGLMALNIITKEQFEALSTMTGGLIAWGFRDAIR